MKDQLSQLTGEHQDLKETVASLRKQLYGTSNDLIKQTKTAFEQGNVIEALTQQMQNLDNSLRVAFGDIRRMHVTLESAQRIERPFEPQLSFRQDNKNITVQKVENTEEEDQNLPEREVAFTESENLSPPRISSSFSPNKSASRKRGRRDELVSQSQQSQSSALEYSVGIPSNRTSPRKDEFVSDLDHSPMNKAIVN